MVQKRTRPLPSVTRNCRPRLVPAHRIPIRQMARQLATCPDQCTCSLEHLRLVLPAGVEEIIVPLVGPDANAIDVAHGRCLRALCVICGTHRALSRVEYKQVYSNLVSMSIKAMTAVPVRVTPNQRSSASRIDITHSRCYERIADTSLSTLPSIPTTMPKPQNQANDMLETQLYTLTSTADHQHLHPSPMANISPQELVRWFKFQDATRDHSAVLETTRILLEVRDLTVLVESVPLTRSQLRVIADAHNVFTTKNWSMPRLKAALSVEHRCSANCSPVRYVFTNRNREYVPFRRAPLPDAPALPLPTQDDNAGIRQAHTDNNVSNIVSATPFVVDDDGDVRMGSPEPAPKKSVFPMMCSPDTRAEIIAEFEDYISPENWTFGACAVCGQRRWNHELEDMSLEEVPLEVLQNDQIPDCAKPIDYDFELYDKAFLCAAGMHNTDMLDNLRVCTRCKPSLQRGKMPLDAIANFQYYGFEALPQDLQRDFRDSTGNERQLIAACRSSRISYIYTADAGGNPRAPQRYTKGNVAIFPQEANKVSTLVPPSPSDIQYSMCVIFLGGKKPTWETVNDFRPVLVSRDRVERMAKFLTQNNAYYKYYGIAYSAENLAELCATDGFHGDRGVTTAVEVIHVEQKQSSEVEALAAMSAGYTNTETERDSGPVTDPALLIMHTVGFSSEEESWDRHDPTTKVATEWCKNRRPYIAVRTGDKLFPDRDPKMLSYLFPHLDPWGIGGFNNPLREPQNRISFERQLKNMMNMYDSRFEKDANFAYVCWNIVQRLLNSRASLFTVKESAYQEVTNGFIHSADLLDRMCEKWAVDGGAQADGEDEKKVLYLINKLKVIAKDYPGSSASKLRMRNEIRGLMKAYGTPALFITLTPADVLHILPHVLSGRSEDSFAARKVLERAKLLAKNPAAAARFFDIMVKGFLDLVVRYGDDRPGLFGTCEAYYGTVEAQGRGCLHCHMLLWIKGNPNPQRLRDILAADPDFKESLFRWLESIISCELPGTTEPFTGDPEKLERPKRDAELNPCSMSAPPLASFGTDDEGKQMFQDSFEHCVRELAIETNWHRHTSTCWKYLKPNESRNSENCRMRMDGSVCARTDMDAETGSLKLRRFHPWISNYNDVMMYLFKCNHDIKYIGSGQDAKALVYYVTDYVTKSTLPTYAALSAVCAAVKRTHAALPSNAEPSIIRKSLLTRMVNGIMGKLELSHQQVMSYLIGGGDHYTSHAFKTLHWGVLDRHIRSQEPKGEHQPDFLYDVNAPQVTIALDPAEEAVIAGKSLDEPMAEDAPEPGNVVVRISHKTLTSSNIVQDYIYRGIIEEFESLTVYDYVALVECIPKEREDKRLKGKQKRSRGAHATTRAEFSSNEHPKFEAYVSRLRKTRLTPVILGPTLPTRGRSFFEDEQWSRAMLILFKPWRCLSDLKSERDTWQEAYEAYAFPAHLRKIITNIQVETECKEARLQADTARRAGHRVGLLAGGSATVREGATREDVLLDALEANPNSNTYADHLDVEGGPEAITQIVSSAMDMRIQESISNMERAGIIKALPHAGILPIDIPIRDDDPIIESFTPPDSATVKRHEKTMKDLKKNKRPVRTRVFNGALPPQSHPAVRWNEATWRTTIMEGHAPDDELSVETLRNLPLSDPARQRAVLEELLREFAIIGNEEQEISVRIVCEHALFHQENQLLMHLSGVGGTGKSHVIRAINEFFRRTGRDQELQLSAPTGIAAVLIGGYTIHALTFLPKTTQSAQKESDLRDIWAHVRYLVIDEVSMLSAEFLSQISTRISQAKSSVDVPFGGVNVIFTGDFGQLKPVRGRALYDPRLSKVKDVNQGQTRAGQAELAGVHLWRQLTHVICLKKNMRQASDAEYAALNSRIRMGQTVVAPTDEHPVTDYRTLYSRCLNILHADDAKMFHDCPVIVSDRAVRDIVNLRIALTTAANKGYTVAYLGARDRIAGKPVNNDLQKKLRGLSSSGTEDLLGYLPYFPGMKIMVTENTDMAHSTVNGSEGVLIYVAYETKDGMRVARCAYVHFPHCGMRMDGLPDDVVPIFPITKRFECRWQRGEPGVWVSRTQLPILPAYSYTDYKSQGRSLDRAIVDITSCRSLQSMYVMLSRVKTLSGLAVLRKCPAAKFASLKCTPEAKIEFARIDRLHEKTTEYFKTQRAAGRTATSSL